MKNRSIVYEEEGVLIAKYDHPKSEDCLEYKSIIRVKESGKNPVEMVLCFDGIYPCAAPMPPEEHIFKAPSILDLLTKVDRWFKKYGYELK